MIGLAHDSPFSPHSGRAFALVVGAHVAVAMVLIQLLDGAQPMLPATLIVHLVKAEQEIVERSRTAQAPTQSRRPAPARPRIEPDSPLEPLPPSDAPARDPEPRADIHPESFAQPLAIEPVSVRAAAPQPDREIAPEPLALPTEPPRPPQVAAPEQPLPPIEQPPAPLRSPAPVKAAANPPVPSAPSTPMPALPAPPAPMRSLEIAAPEAPRLLSRPVPDAVSEIHPEPVRAAPKPDAPSPSISASLATSDALLSSSPPMPPQTAAPEDIELTPELVRATYLRNPKPVYPSVSRRLGEQGTVMLRVFVTARGEPVQVQLKVSSGYPRLDRAALDAVRDWRFVPAKRGGDTVDAWVIVPIKFSIKG